MPTSILQGKNTYYVVIAESVNAQDYWSGMLQFIFNNASVNPATRAFDYTFLEAERSETETKLVVSINNKANSNYAWNLTTGLVPVRNNQGTYIDVTSTLELHTAGTDSPYLALDEVSSVIKEATIALRMGHNETYLDGGLTKIRNFGTNGVPGYLLCGGALVDSANCRKVDYGQKRGFRSNAAYLGHTDPVVRIPQSDFSSSSDFTVAVLYSNRHQTEANAWGTLMQIGPNGGNAVVPVRMKANSAFLSEIGASDYAGETLCNMGRGSLILASGSGSVSVFKDERKLADTTKVSTSPTADHCFGGGYSGASYFSSQAAIFEILVWDRKLSDLEVAEVQKHFSVLDTYDLDIFDGQSNNNGQGLASEIPSSVKAALRNTSRQYDHFRNQKWMPINAGASGFGPWLNYQYLTSRDCVIGGRNGTSIAGWFPEGDLGISEEIYDSFAKGIWKRKGTPKFTECFFHQGETDAESNGAAILYASRFGKYLRYRRELMQNSTARITYPTIPTDSSLIERYEVNDAKELYAGEENNRMITVPTNYLVDGVHLNAAGQLWLGAQEAQ